MTSSGKGWLSVLAVLGILSLTACPSHNAQSGQNAQDASTSSKPKPAMVLVYRFHIPSDLSMERFSTGTSARGHDTAGERQLVLADEVQDALAHDLVDRINALGIPASLSSISLKPQPGWLLVQGQFISRDQLDPSHRNVIGYEPRQSVVLVHVTVSQLSAKRSQLVTEFTTRAQSAPMPDALVDVSKGSGDAGNHDDNPASTAVAHYKLEVDQLASQSADQASTQIGQYLSKQGWISPHEK
jgi:Domain of unknown function (DUF4410)